MSSSIGPALVVLGIVVTVIGLLAWSGGLSWFGRLPGDIRIQREALRVYIPITSMLITSLVLSLVLYLINRFF